MILHVLTYVFVFTLGGAVADAIRLAVFFAARRRTGRLLVDPARLRLDVDRAPYLDAARREVDEMFWETSSLGRPALSEAARLEHGAVTGCSNPACLGGHAPNEAAVPEPRELDLTGFVSTVTIVGADGTLVKLPDAGGPVVIDGHTLPAVDDGRWTKYSDRSCSFPPSLSVWYDGEVILNGKTWFTHKAAKAYYKLVDARVRPIADAKAQAALAASIADVEAAARKRS